MYKINLGALSREDVVCAIDAARHEWSEHQEQFETFKRWLLHQLELDDKEVVSIAPRLNYDYIVSTIQNTPRECAQLIANFLKGTK